MLQHCAFCGFSHFSCALRRIAALNEHLLSISMAASQLACRALTAWLWLSTRFADRDNEKKTLAHSSVEWPFRNAQCIKAWMCVRNCGSAHTKTCTCLLCCSFIKMKNVVEAIIKGEAVGWERGSLRLFGQLSVVNDLQLIRPMCSACGNALHVVTAWKHRLVMDGGLVGGFLCVRPWWGRIHSSSLFLVRGEGGISVQFLLCCSFRGPLRSFSHLALTVWGLWFKWTRNKVCQLCLDKSLGVSRRD